MRPATAAISGTTTRRMRRRRLRPKRGLAPAAALAPPSGLGASFRTGSAMALLVEARRGPFLGDGPAQVVLDGGKLAVEILDLAGVQPVKGFAQQVFAERVQPRRHRRRRRR